MILIVAAAAAGPALAHSLYFMPDRFHAAAGERLAFAIHNGDSFPASEGPPAIERLRDCRLASGGESVSIADFERLEKSARAAVRIPKQGAWWLAVRTIPHFLSLDAAKFESYLKHEGLEAVIEQRARRGESARPGREIYSKHAKALIVAGGSGDAWSRPLGMTLEFVPEADPALWKPGEALPVRLLWRGQPAAGIRVESAWAAGANHGMAVVGRTGGDGRIRVHIDKAGRWRLHAVAIERRGDSAEADWESFWASMTFEVEASR